MPGNDNGTRPDRYRLSPESFFACVFQAYESLDDATRAELQAWEDRNVTGSGACGTSDWPGWSGRVVWWEEWQADLADRHAVRRSQAKAPIPVDLRWAVWERDNFVCQGCGTRRNLSVDHVKAESRGGPTTLDNLQTLCRPCNSRKGAR